MIGRLENLKLTVNERAWLETKCPYFKSTYLDCLSEFRFRPAQQVDIKFVPDANEPDWGAIELVVTGLWRETILYEVPLMAIISQAHFLVDDTQWDYSGQKRTFLSSRGHHAHLPPENAYEKGKSLFEAGCMVAEFGTRRRRTYTAHKVVIEGLVRAHGEAASAKSPGKLTGTSNVHFAHLFDVPPIGTIAHEWIMGVAALEGYEGSNGLAMDKWDQTYPDGQLTIALTDTFSSKPFFEDLQKNVARARRWRGLRQDSGDPKTFAKQAKEVYDAMGIDAKTSAFLVWNLTQCLKAAPETIVFSDGLTPAVALDLQAFCQDLGIGCSFGVGTSECLPCTRGLPNAR
jgi:nicotinate phosphoribosyltransferase